MFNFSIIKHLNNTRLLFQLFCIFDLKDLQALALDSVCATLDFIYLSIVLGLTLDCKALDSVRVTGSVSWNSCISAFTFMSLFLDTSKYVQ